MKHLNSPQEFLRRLLRVSEFLGLTVVGIATTAAMANETWSMLTSHRVTLTDLLLMFLFLLLLALGVLLIRYGQIRLPAGDERQRDDEPGSHR